MSDENKIFYRNSYGFCGEQLRSFNVFGYTISEEIGVEKINDKVMVLHNEREREKVQVTVSLHKNPNNITVDDFIKEFNRLRDLPNKGKNLFDKN